MLFYPIEFQCAEIANISDADVPATLVPSIRHMALGADSLSTLTAIRQTNHLELSWPGERTLTLRRARVQSRVISLREKKIRKIHGSTIEVWKSC